MSYKKLVRDNIPNIISNNGEKPIFRILSDNEYKLELEKKLLEEANEVVGASDDKKIEELADLLEVMITLAKLNSKSLDDILKFRKIKLQKCGAFNRKIFLEDVES